jgi:hypothetical protein
MLQLVFASVATSFYSFGQDAHATVGGFYVLRAFCPPVSASPGLSQKRWCRLDGHEHIVSLLEGKKFVDGILQDAA